MRLIASEFIASELIANDHAPILHDHTFTPPPNIDESTYPDLCST